MNFVLPFTDDVVKAMADRTVVISRNDLGPWFRKDHVLKVSGGGDFLSTGGKGYFHVSDGVLKVSGSKGDYCQFTGLEARNGVVYAVGIPLNVVQAQGYDRVTLHEQCLLPKDGYGICISSHVSYADKTLPILLESIRKARFDMGKVVAVIGGAIDNGVGDPIEGAKVLYRTCNGSGLGGLMETTESYPYWLMLQDTCEMERTFLETIGDIDIGLSPDVVCLRSDGADWMGFFRTGFIQKLRNFSDLAQVVGSEAKIITTLGCACQVCGTKDVYGKGHQRTIEKMSVGIRKFRSAGKRRGP